MIILNYSPAHCVVEMKHWAGWFWSATIHHIFITVIREIVILSMHSKYIFSKLQSCWKLMVTSGKTVAWLLKCVCDSASVREIVSRVDTSMWFYVRTVCRLCMYNNMWVQTERRTGGQVQLGREHFITSSVLWNNPLQQHKEERASPCPHVRCWHWQTLHVLSFLLLCRVSFPRVHTHALCKCWASITGNAKCIIHLREGSVCMLKGWLR